MRNLALIASIIAVALHALSLPTVLALRGAIALELLALGSLAVFAAVRYAQPDERRVAWTCIFTASLVLSLAAPALLLPPAAGRGEWWALLGGSDLEPGAAMPAFALWMVSLFVGGVAMHLLVALRWRRLRAAMEAD